MKHPGKRKYRPGFPGWVIAGTFFLVISGCGGGGDSEPTDAAPPPAPSGDNPDDPAEPSDPVDPVEPALKLSCSASPGSGNSGTVEPGGTVIATFNFNKSFDGTGVIRAASDGQAAIPANTTISRGELVVNRTAPDSGGYTINLTADGTGLSESCSWIVVVQAIFNP